MYMVYVQNMLLSLIKSWQIAVIGATVPRKCDEEMYSLRMYFSSVIHVVYVYMYFRVVINDCQ